MDENSQAAYIMAQVACALIGMEGMKADNLQRQACCESPAYVQNDFDNLLVEYCISHNEVIGYLRK